MAKEKKEKKYSGYGYHGGGRKPKIPGQSKRLTMCIVVTENEKLYIQGKAIKANKTISNYILDKVIDKKAKDKVLRGEV